MSEAESVKRMNAIIRLLIEGTKGEELKRKDQLLILDSLGFSSGEIEGILGVPSKDVSSALKKLKKASKKPSH
jgi:predicted transcriptional regulator